MFEGVIFDLEGLIVNNEALQVQAWNKYLERHQVQLGIEEWEEFAGQRAFNIAELLRRRYELAEDPLTITEERQAILLDLVDEQEQIEEMPGAVETIELFKNNDLKFAIATSDYKDYVWAVLEKLRLDEMVDVLVTGDNISEVRPSPLPLFACAETFALHPANCLTLAKDRAGVEAAINAGMKSICIPGPKVARWRITGADLVLPSLYSLNMMSLRSIWFDIGEEPRPQLYRSR